MHQAISWTNVDLLSIEPLGTKTSDMQWFSFKKMNFACNVAAILFLL